MQNDNQQKTVLDDDILQCKADLQKALNAVLRASTEAVPPSEQRVQPSQPLQSLHLKQTQQIGRAHV